MYKCIYIYMYPHVFIHIYIYVFTHISVYIHLYTRIYTPDAWCNYLCMCACVLISYLSLFDVVVYCFFSSMFTLSILMKCSFLNVLLSLYNSLSLPSPLPVSLRMSVSLTLYPPPVSLSMSVSLTLYLRIYMSLLFCLPLRIYISPSLCES